MIELLTERSAFCPCGAVATRVVFVKARPGATDARRGVMQACVACASRFEAILLRVRTAAIGQSGRPKWRRGQALLGDGEPPVFVDVAREAQLPRRYVGA